MNFRLSNTIDITLFLWNNSLILQLRSLRSCMFCLNICREYIQWWYFLFGLTFLVSSLFSVRGHVENKPCPCRVKLGEILGRISSIYVRTVEKKRKGSHFSTSGDVAKRIGRTSRISSVISISSAFEWYIVCEPHPITRLVKRRVTIYQ